jgi:TonB family protein
MKQYYLSLFFWIVFQTLFSQTSIDTIYLNANKSVVTGKDYVYYRILTQDSTGLFLFNDFKKNGYLDETGKLSSLDPLIREGEHRWYHANGIIKQIANFSNNHIVGFINLFDSDGNLELKYLGDVDSLDNSMELKEKMHEFRVNVAENLRYPLKPARKGIEGRVIVRFVLNDQGKSEGVQVVQSVNDELDNEAIRVVKHFDKWPAPLYKGEGVNLLWYFPVNFVLQNRRR